MPDQPGVDVDWENWTAEMRSMLVFIKRENEVLLIRKKRGLGAGKINGPGGKVDDGETLEEAAVRETQEEIGLTPTALEHRGELYFQFADGLSIHCTVFVSESFEGELTETDEAEPMWVAIDAIPFDEMWEDDRYWLPQVLEGESFKGYFTFDDDKMLSQDIQFESDLDEGAGKEEPGPPAHHLEEPTFLHLQRIVESLIMASESPITIRALSGTLKKVADDQAALAAEAAKEGEAFSGPDVAWVEGVTEDAIEAAIAALNASYEREERAFTIAERASGYKIFTRPGFGLWVRGLFPDQKPQRLRPPALETLAIVAYRQPLTKADIEAVRGVSVDSVLKMLLDRNLVQIGGRAETPGRPLLYQTTDLFLDHFGIRTVDELPNAEELRKVELPKAPSPEAEEEGDADADGEAETDTAAEAASAEESTDSNGSEPSADVAVEPADADEDEAPENELEPTTDGDPDPSGEVVADAEA